MKFKDIFRFHPRAGREEFALIGACCLLFSLAGVIVTQEITPRLLSPGKILVLLPLILLNALASLLSLWLWLGVFVRRLHDFNFSGWWLLAYLLVTLTGALAFPSLTWGFTALGAAVYLFLALKKAPAEPNRFGAEAPAFLPRWFKWKGMVWVFALLGLFFSLSNAAYTQYRLKTFQARQAAVLTQPAENRF